MKKRVLIDANALVLWFTGAIDTKLIGKSERTSIYGYEDYVDMMTEIEDTSNLVVLPNVWTELDNLLNGFTGDHKYIYLQFLIDTIKKSTEEYLETSEIEDSLDLLYDLGVTDVILLKHAKKCSSFITGDSALSDYAKAYGIKVYDIIRIANDRYKPLYLRED